MSEELLPCAHCGGEAVIRRDDDPRWPFYVTFNHADDCCMYAVPFHMCRSYATEVGAIAAWNTRAPDPRIAELEAEVEKLRNASHDLPTIAYMAGAADARADLPHYARNLIKMVDNLRDGEVLHVRKVKDAGVRMEVKNG